MPRDVHPTPFVVHPSDELAKNIDLKNLSRNLATKYVDGHVVTDDDLQIMGRNLWNGLSADAQGAFEAARKEAGEKILPVVIHSDAADVQALPWETLFHPTYGFIGKNPGFTLTRRNSAQVATDELDQGPLRVLLFTSLPANVDPERSRLEVEEEQAEVQAALLPWIAQGLVTLEMPDDGRFSTLQNLLKEFQPHVLFLSGHGNFHHMPHANEAYGEFFFEDEAGDSVGVKEDEIADALRGTGVQAVILSACESGKAASDELSNGLTRKISAAGIPHVVGMREAIYDIAGIQFARALCDSLPRQERMDVALQAARIAIQTPFKDVARASSSIGDELSYGQWCLPLLISSAPSRALINWDFTPREVEARAISQKINTVIMPARFIGRRAEMRKYKNSLLITGPGGQGKTSLAGKLALDLQAHGYRLFAWSAQPENSWRDFELEMEQTLDRPRVDRYDRFLPRTENESARAQFLLDLLMEQFNGHVVLFLDNLETIQDPDTLALKDATVEAWLRAANHLQGMILLVTSRWQIPHWDGKHEPLTHVNYGDFLQIAQRLSLPSAFLTRRNSLRQVYDILGGNVRGLEFFAAAVRDMENADEENAFLEKLSTVKEDLQANMAIEAIYNRLPADAKTLLHRLPAFHEPVPMEGLLKLAPDLSNPETLLERLLAVSLLEASYEPHWQVTEYQCPQMVMDWMRGKGLVDDDHGWLNAAADYYLYLLDNVRKTLPQAITTHHALLRVERHSEADRLALSHIIEPIALTNSYTELLDKWLPKIRESQDLKVRVEAWGYTSKYLLNIDNYESAFPFIKHSLEIAQNIGDRYSESGAISNMGFYYYFKYDYEMALHYFKQSLEIDLEIANKSGQATTLNAIAQIHHDQGDYKTALLYLEQSLVLEKQIGDKMGEAGCLNNISQIYYDKKDYKSSLNYLKSSILIFQELGSKAEEATALFHIGRSYRGQGDDETALSYYRNSLAILQQVGNKRREARTLGEIANIYISRNDYDLALTYCKKALGISQQLGDKKQESALLENISGIYKHKGYNILAFSLLNQSLAISQQIGDKLGECSVSRKISELYLDLGDFTNALLQGDNALRLSRQIDDNVQEVNAIMNLSKIYSSQGDNKTALYYMKQLLEGKKQLGGEIGEADLLINISKILSDQGEYTKALNYQKRALAIARRLNDGYREGDALYYISQVYYKMKETKLALDYCEKSLKAQKLSGDTASESVSLNMIALVYQEQGDNPKAIFYLEKALALKRQISDKIGEGVTLFNLGSNYFQLKQFINGVDAWNNAYLISKIAGNSELLQLLGKYTPVFDAYMNGQNIDEFMPLFEFMNEERRKIEPFTKNDTELKDNSVKEKIKKKRKRKK